jgi:hypothetical protein
LGDYQCLHPFALKNALIRSIWHVFWRKWQALNGSLSYPLSHQALSPSSINECPMSSIQNQFLDLTAHHARYAAIDPKSVLEGSALGKVIFIAGASRGIGQATAVAFAEAGAKAIYLTARSEGALKETKGLVEGQPANAMRLCGLRCYKCRTD